MTPCWAKPLRPRSAIRLRTRERDHPSIRLQVSERSKVDEGNGRFWRNAAIRPKADFSQVRHSIISRTAGLSLLHLQAALSRLLTHP